jgi:hypothetical protein
MRGYIEWLQPVIPHLKKEMPARLGRIRSELFQIGSHLRQADAFAQLRGAFELLLEFAENVGALDAACACDLRATARHTLRGIGEAQGSVLRDLEPAEWSMSVLGTLLERRRVRLVRKGTSPTSDDAEAVGWFDEDFAYLLPEAARRRVATFLRESGEAWAHGAHVPHKALVRKGYVLPGPDARPEMQVRVGDGKRRVLRVRLTALRGAHVPDPVPAVSPNSGETGDGVAREDHMEDPGDSAIMSPSYPTSPGSGGRPLGGKLAVLLPPVDNSRPEKLAGIIPAAGVSPASKQAMDRLPKNPDQWRLVGGRLIKSAFEWASPETRSRPRRSVRSPGPGQSR